MSPRRVITASPPGRSSRASAAISREERRASSPPCEPAAASTWMIAGRISTRLRAAGWSKRTAPQISVVALAAAAVAEDLVALADELALEVEDPRRRRTGLAAQDVALAVRDEREVAGAEQPRARASPASSQMRPEVTTWNQT